MTEQKLYVVVRADLEPGAQLAQSVHAALALANAHPEAERAWHADSNNLVVLTVPDEPALEVLFGHLLNDGGPCTGFSEPDLGGQLTAFAVLPRSVRYLSSLPLALRSGQPPKPPIADARAA